jgi:hypothetical protein
LLGVYEESEGEEIRESAQRERPRVEIVTASSGYAEVVGEVFPAPHPGSLSAGADKIEQETEARARTAIEACTAPHQVTTYMGALKTTDAVLAAKLRDVGKARFWALSPPRPQPALPDARKPLPADHVGTPSEAQEPIEVSKF